MLAKSKEHEVPITLRFQELRDEQMQPAHGELPFFLQENTVIQFLQYPYEQVVAENFVEILEKMELINDLSCYEEIYGILKKEALDGRKDWVEVMTLLEAFFPPVWRAIIRDEIFIGDWMPELCRFL